MSQLDLVGKVQSVLELQAAPHMLIQAHSLPDKTGLFMYEGRIYRKQRRIIDSDLETSVQLISPYCYYGIAICVDLHYRLHSMDVRRANAFLRVGSPSYQINGIARILAELERNCPKCVLLR